MTSIPWCVSLEPNHQVTPTLRKLPNFSSPILVQYLSHVSRPKLLTFDHIHPPPAQTPSPPPRTAILYASLSSKNFKDLHNYLFSLANSKPTPQIEYVLRYAPATRVHEGEPPNAEGNYLSGYGVALDLKKTDYLAVDDRYGASRGS